MRKTLFSILKLRKPSSILKRTVPSFIPEIKPCINFDGGIHHGETVFEHLLLACDSVSPKYPLIRLAALLHDIGKPETFKNGMFTGHEIDSQKIAEKFLFRTNFLTPKEIQFVLALIGVHMIDCQKTRPGKLAFKFNTLAEQGVSWRDFVRLRCADKIANKRKGWKPNEVVFQLKPLVSRIKIALSWTPPVPKPLAEVTGTEVMEILGLTPGPQVGMVLRELEGLDRESALQKLEEMNCGMRM